MINKIKCTINTPVSGYTSKAGNMIVLPGRQGELGILYDHMPLIAELKVGKIRIYNDNSIEQEIDVNEGIAYINKDKIEIFCSI